VFTEVWQCQHKNYIVVDRLVITPSVISFDIPSIGTEEVLLLFVAHLANEKLAYSTIKVYLSVLRNLHVATGYHQTFASQLTPK